MRQLALLSDDLCPVLNRGIELRPEVNPLGVILRLTEMPHVIVDTYAQMMQSVDASAFTLLQFLTPASFRVNDMHYVFPEPGLVFGSYLGRWNAFAPVELRIGGGVTFSVGLRHDAVWQVSATRVRG